MLELKLVIERGVCVYVGECLGLMVPGAILKKNLETYEAITINSLDWSQHKSGCVNRVW